MRQYPSITREDIEMHWPNYALDYFADLLSGECSLDDTRKDILSLINKEPT